MCQVMRPASEALSTVGLWPRRPIINEVGGGFKSAKSGTSKRQELPGAWLGTEEAVFGHLLRHAEPSSVYRWSLW